MAHHCASCHITPASKVCSRCKKVHYCCQSCQANDWESHKNQCHKHYVKKKRKKQTHKDISGYVVRPGFLKSVFNLQSPQYVGLNQIIIANWIRHVKVTSSLQLCSLYTAYTTEFTDAIINTLVIPQSVLNRMMYFHNDVALLSVYKWKSVRCIDIKFLEYLELKAFGVLESEEESKQESQHATCMSYYEVDIFFLVTFEDINTLRRDSQIIKVFNASKMNGEPYQKTDECKWRFASDLCVSNVLSDLRLLPVSYFIQCKLSHRSEWILTHFCIISFSTRNATIVGDLEGAFCENMSHRGMKIVADKQPIKYRAWNPFALKYEYVDTESYISTKDYWLFAANDLYLLNRKIQKRRIGVDIDTL